MSYRCIFCSDRAEDPVCKTCHNKRGRKAAATRRAPAQMKRAISALGMPWTESGRSPESTSWLVYGKTRRTRMMCLTDFAKHSVSRLAGKVAPEVADWWRQGVLFATVEDLLASEKAGFKDGETWMSGLIIHARSVPFLLIDGLGREHPTAWSTGVLTALLVKRDQELNLTVVGTSLDKNAIRRHYGDAGEVIREELGSYKSYICPEE